MSRSWILRLLCLLGALAGCAQEERATAIVLYVQSDLAAVDEVEYRVFGDDDDARMAGTEPVFGAAPLPQTFVIRKGKAARVLVEVTAHAEGRRPMVTQRAYVRFVANATVSAPIALARACAALPEPCTDERTCTVDATGVAACGPIAEVPTKPVIEAGDEKSWDAGFVTAPSAPDGGARDAASELADAEAPSSADAGVGEDAVVPDAAPDCAPSRPRGVCHVVTGCGCADQPDTHCQARDAAGPACFPIGKLALNQRCTSHGECAQGLACVGSLCRKYCAAAEECDGDCVATSEAIIEKVCIERCELGTTCAPGIPCVQRKGDVSEGRCLFGREDCAEPNKECEEPIIGSGTCAVGTDVEDCCPGKKGDCDLLDSCGCREGLACQLPTTDVVTNAQCGSPGSKRRGETCNGQAECPKGLGCFGGMCAEYCKVDDDCEAGGVCTRLSDIGVSYCRYRCSPRMQGGSDCQPGTTCMGPANNAFCIVELP